MKTSSRRTKTPSGEAKARRAGSVAPKATPRAARNRATLIFRDFVRQLEKLSVAEPKPGPGAHR
ncbi:hypothetical protein [Microvirga pudoricolor]|uniref:hypothetical protein n=1 Tax=Microvirga pudoricolor TaxID=2778729 RepID=UPI00194E1D2D|nr:hypothetical protein [Microvirga pudoricolor]MBM6592385.1 hypothetical protein [Microvirga pudoricolor]